MASRTQQLYKVTLDWGYEKEVLEGWGNTPSEATADAMNRAGYGGGSIRVLKSWNAELAEGIEENQ